MKQTLKVTNVLGDPTRFNIYQHIIRKHQEVTVLEISKRFEIHPNVARLHLSKLEDINMLKSFSRKSGKGGRPSRVYSLSDEVIELNFPHRDYKLLSTIAIESFVELGEPGKHALYRTGNKYGLKAIENYQAESTLETKSLTIEEKLHILSGAGTMLGMYPDFQYNEKDNSIAFKINNCPFKEVAVKNHSMVCEMHNSFIRGMFEALFTNIKLIEKENMFKGCENCTYIAEISTV